MNVSIIIYKGELDDLFNFALVVHSTCAPLKKSPNCASHIGKRFGDSQLIPNSN